MKHRRIAPVLLAVFLFLTSCTAAPPQATFPSATDPTRATVPDGAAALERAARALDGLIPTSLDVREGAKNRIRGFWVNCTYASILTLLRMAELTGETAGFPADVSHAR